MRAKVSVKWYGKSYTRLVARHLEKNLERAAEFDRDQIRQSISRPGSYDPPDHSLPGEPPKKIFGDLWKSYTFAHVGPLRWGVGSDYPVAADLELGTAIMAPRPHLRRSLADNRVALLHLITEPL